MKIFVRDLKVLMLIGIYRSEQQTPQDVLINIDAIVTEPSDWRRDNMADWVNYEGFVSAARNLIAEGHVGLLETFAHRLAERLLTDKRIESITIRLEKISAIEDTRSVGVEYRQSNVET